MNHKKIFFIAVISGLSATVLIMHFAGDGNSKPNSTTDGKNLFRIANVDNSIRSAVHLILHDPFFIKLDPESLSLRQVSSLDSQPPILTYKGDIIANETNYEVTVVFPQTRPPVVTFSEIGPTL